MRKIFIFLFFIVIAVVMFPITMICFISDGVFHYMDNCRDFLVKYIREEEQE